MINWGIKKILYLSVLTLSLFLLSMESSIVYFEHLNAEIMFKSSSYFLEAYKKEKPIDIGRYGLISPLLLFERCSTYINYPCSIFIIININKSFPFSQAAKEGSACKQNW